MTFSHKPLVCTIARNRASLLPKRLPSLSLLPARARTDPSALTALAVAAIAGGAMAIGALAIGRLAIGKLSVGRLRVGKLEIDELAVRRIRPLSSTEQLVRIGDDDARTPPEDQYTKERLSPGGEGQSGGDAKQSRRKRNTGKGLERASQPKG